MDEHKDTIVKSSYSYRDTTNLPQGYVIDDRYRIEEKLGVGGFGTVYKAWDTNIECYKALKVIHTEFYDDKQVIEELRHEAKLLMSVLSPHVVRMWDIHLSGNIKYLDMEYIGGGDLVDLKLSYPDRRVPEDKMLTIAQGIISGMIDIHKKNIVHKDLKPQNVMMTEEGEAKIMDFSIAETFRTSKSRIEKTRIAGTPAFMSPEQLIGQQVGKESDVWSFGVMVYELLTGRTCFGGSTTSEVHYSIKERLDVERDKETRGYIQHGNLTFPNGISEKTKQLINKCLQYDFQDRFRNFIEIEKFFTERQKEEVKPDVQEIVEKQKVESKIEEKEIPQKPELKKETKKKSTVFFKILLGISIVAIVIIGGIMVNKDIQQRRENKKRRDQIAQEDKIKNQVQTTLREANNYLNRGELTKAKQKYNAVLSLESNNYKAKQGLKQVMLLKENNMIFIKGDTFQMGSNSSDDAKPVNTVTVSDFYIGKYEVTQKEWKEVMGSNPSYFKGDNLPAERVSWYDAVEFCNKKSRKEGLTPCYSGSGTDIKCNFYANGYRLPTEAEWEYAARGGSESKGFLYAGSNNIDDVAWYDVNSGKKTHPIGKKQPNELGIYDMTGNVREWCWDIESSGYGKRATRSGAFWYYVGYYLRCVDTNHCTPHYTLKEIGLRLCRTAK